MTVATPPRELQEVFMQRCETCGNEYDKAFEVVMAGQRHVFDSFECAIQALAPTCSHCGCRIMGHGMEAGGQMFCCAHCAENSGVKDMKDRAN
jgi:hypothetical protein